MFGYVKKKDVLAIIDQLLTTDRKIYHNCQCRQDRILRRQIPGDAFIASDLSVFRSPEVQFDKYEFDLESQTAAKYIEAASQLANIRQQIEDL